MKLLAIFSSGFLALLLFGGCVTPVDRHTDIPDAVATLTVVPPVTPQPSTPVPTLSPTPSPVPPTPSPTPLLPLFLDVLSPPFGANVRTEVLSVVGMTRPRVAVKVNSTLVRADENGKFEVNVALSRGQNIIAVLLTADDASQLRDFITVVYDPPPTPTPPPFFLEIDRPGNVTIVGAQPVLLTGRTSPQSRVTVNGVGVPVDDIGRFSTRVELAVGNNVIQVLAINPQGRTRRSTISVIYDP